MSLRAECRNSRDPRRFPEHQRLNVVLAVGRRLARRNSPLAKLVDLFNRVVFSCDIPSILELPQGVIFFHNGLGTAIDRHVRFEGPALIMQHVTLGESVGGKPGRPVIGSHVVVGAGATVVGGLRVGDGSLIAAGTVVTRDVPAWSKAEGNPVRITPLSLARIASIWPEADLDRLEPADPRSAGRSDTGQPR